MLPKLGKEYHDINYAVTNLLCMQRRQIGAEMLMTEKSVHIQINAIHTSWTSKKLLYHISPCLSLPINASLYQRTSVS